MINNLVTRETTAVDRSARQKLLQLKDVSKVYKTGSGDFTALSQVNLDIYQGEFLGIIGKSGAGKTTLLNMISGVSEVTTGDVLFHLHENPVNGDGNLPLLLNKLSEDDLAVWRGENLGVVYQSFELLPQLDLVTNIMLPQDFAGSYQIKISRERALELLDIVELTEHAYKLPAHISGGQKQRVAIARALVNDPPIIVADEPTGSLDTITAETIFKIFEKLVAQGKTIIMVTHDNNLAGRFSRKLRISDGMVAKAKAMLPSMATASPTNGHAATAVKEAVSVPQESEANEIMKAPALLFQNNGQSLSLEKLKQPAIQLQNVVKIYENAAGKFPALKGIDLKIQYGQFVSLVGKSGSGKSTLLNMLTGIDHPTSGEVIIGGENIYQLSESQRARWRGRNMGIVFQFFQLLPTLSLLENTMLPMDYTNTFSASERPERAYELLKMVGLEDHIYDLPAAVSNGQQQSAAIARSIATDPPIIVADEPTGNLDSRSANNIIRVFQELAGRGKTILIVTHDPSLTSKTDQTIIISDGEIIDKTVASALPYLDHPLMLQATRLAEHKMVAPGETILQQGDQVDYFYMVAKGEVDIVIKRPPAPEMNVARLGPGQFFGEVEMLHDTKSIASVQAANTSVELVMVSKIFFHELLKESAVTEDRVRQIAQNRREENLRYSKRES